jgi:signal recognition particle receptor subunit beta
VSSVNLLTREIAIKVVYYGPGLGGKTSSLQFIHRALKPDSRGQLVSLATGVDRTLYFDFLPVKLPKLRGFAVRVQLYTVPGQVHYNSTRKLVLTGADAVVFVADSQRDRSSANTESLENLVENLREQGLTLRTMPFVLQYNTRDCPDPNPVSEMQARLNPAKAPAFETVATKGTGVFDALKAVTSLVLVDLRKKGAIGAGEGAASSSSTTSSSGGSGSGPAAINDAVPQPIAPIDSSARRKSTAPLLELDSNQITLGSLGEVADAIEKLQPADARTTSGTHRMPSAAPSRALSDLLAQGSARDALMAMEVDVERGDWNACIRHGTAAFRDLSARLAGSLAPSGDAGALAALLTNLPANRYLRFREVCDRVAQGGAVSSTDAIFGLFFLCDFALRVEKN